MQSVSIEKKTIVLSIKLFALTKYSQFDNFEVSIDMLIIYKIYLQIYLQNIFCKYLQNLQKGHSKSKLGKFYRVLSFWIKAKKKV